MSKSSLLWIADELSDEPSFIQKKMFGSIAIYLFGQLKLVLSDQKDPWCGVLVCTDKSRHSTLQDKVTELLPHPVLGKWLYLPQASDEFESHCQSLIRLLRGNSQLIGVEPKATKRRKPIRRPPGIRRR
jgi:hypothetical protein